MAYSERYKLQEKGSSVPWLPMRKSKALGKPLPFPFSRKIGRKENTGIQEVSKKSNWAPCAVIGLGGWDEIVHEVGRQKCRCPILKLAATYYDHGLMRKSKRCFYGSFSF